MHRHENSKLEEPCFCPCRRRRLCHHHLSKCKLTDELPLLTTYHALLRTTTTTFVLFFHHLCHARPRLCQSLTMPPHYCCHLRASTHASAAPSPPLLATITIGSRYYSSASLAALALHAPAEAIRMHVWFTHHQTGHQLETTVPLLPSRGRL